jgi:hypothetical protein
MLSADRGYKESQQAIISLSMPFDNDDVDAGITAQPTLACQLSHPPLSQPRAQAVPWPSF